MLVTVKWFSRVRRIVASLWEEIVKLVMRAGALRVAFRDHEMLLAGGSDVLCICAIDPPESPAIPLVPGDGVCSL